MRKLHAISDLHLDYQVNFEALAAMSHYGEDWLITGGDLCTKGNDLRAALDLLCKKFAKVFWVPGNHELWSSRDEHGSLLSGEKKYEHLISICQEYGVHTPEDSFVKWEGAGGPCYIVPLFMTYDYSFRPASIPLDQAIAWAAETGILCNDEKFIQPEPFQSMIAWCQSRLDYSLRRLGELPQDSPLVLVNHFPLREDLVRLYRIPRFSIWCGTKQTESWHTRFPVKVVVSGHLHMRATDFRDGVRFEEVSLGYPQHWNQAHGIGYYLREILPGVDSHPNGSAGPIWRYY